MFLEAIVDHEARFPAPLARSGANKIRQRYLLDWVEAIRCLTTLPFDSSLPSIADLNRHGLTGKTVFEWYALPDYGRR